MIDDNESMKKLICSLIVKTYERSTSFSKEKTVGNKSIKIYESIKEYKEPDFKSLFNKTALEMIKGGLIKVKWIDFNNIIEKISFNVKDIDMFYKIANVEKKQIVVDFQRSLLESYYEVISMDWIRFFINDMIVLLNEKKTVPKYISDKLNILMHAIKYIHEISNEDGFMLERIFSKKYLGDSKLFEREIKNVLVSIIKKYNNSNIFELTDQQVIEYVGIEKAGNDLHIKGDITINFDGNLVNLKSFKYGIGLNHLTIKNSKIVNCNCKRIISIENKTNYIMECFNSSDDDVIIFSSGFYSPLKVNFLRQFNELLFDNVEYLHTGDMDLGGLNIFIHIKQGIFPHLKPYKMNKEIFIQNLKFAEQIGSKDYLHKLTNLLEDSRFCEFKDLVEEMLRTRKRLEQEALLF